MGFPAFFYRSFTQTQHGQWLPVEEPLAEEEPPVAAEPHADAPLAEEPPVVVVPLVADVSCDDAEDVFLCEDHELKSGEEPEQRSRTLDKPKLTSWRPSLEKSFPRRNLLLERKLTRRTVSPSGQKLSCRPERTSASWDLSHARKSANFTRKPCDCTKLKFFLFEALLRPFLSSHVFIILNSSFVDFHREESLFSFFMF